MGTAYLQRMLKGLAWPGFGVHTDRVQGEAGGEDRGDIRESELQLRGHRDLFERGKRSGSGTHLHDGAFKECLGGTPGR